MEGVGARLGRSSTRYGPATVFNGPVRKWKKRWVHVTPSATTSNNNNHSQTHHHHLRNTTSNGTTASTTNRNNSSHLFLYKWTPLIQKESNGDNDMISDKDEAEAAAAPEDPPRRKFKYIPIVLLEEERKEAEENEAAEQVDTETKPSDGGVIDVESTRKNNGFDEKPDINDIPIEEIQSPGNNQIVRQDLNESTLDLSLGLSARDNDSDSKSDQNKNEQLERVNT